jgi:hypothetical protein
MPEGTDSAAAAFQRAIDPAPAPGESVPGRQQAPRDTSGRFAAVAERPESMFEPRIVEGDPETGDTRDGGDDPRLRSRERGIADGWIDERQDRETQSRSRQAPAQTQGESGERRVQPDGGEELHSAAADDGHAGAEDEQEDAAADAAGDEEGEDDEPQYEITVDGQPTTVSLGELRDGYIRTATFHSRLNKVNEGRAVVEQENARVTQLRDLYVQGLQFLDEDLRGIMPVEPDWEAEFTRDPANAHRMQKEFNKFHAKLNQIRQNRAWAIQNGREENDRRSAQYAADQFTQFVQDHSKLIKDEPSLRRIIGGMRQTALSEGFNEQEVAGVYDKRMLNILLKAHLYDQGMAVRPQAVIPGKGKALVPGSARPLLGSAGRRNIDEAQRQLARTGRMEDATAFFDRLLR